MTSTATLALLSAVAAAVWAGIIMILHVFKPELQPKTRMISEYARSPHGWVMQAAFFAMAASCWALAAAVLSFGRLAGPILLTVCGIGLTGAGLFTTDPVLPAEKIQTRSGALHILFAFTVMLLFPIAATVVLAGMTALPGERWDWLLALTCLTWAGLLGFIGAAVRSTGQPGAPVGYLERFLVATYTAWLIGIGLALATEH